jgi:hypothetical protein
LKETARICGLDACDLGNSSRVLWTWHGISWPAERLSASEMLGCEDVKCGEMILWEFFDQLLKEDNTSETSVNLHQTTRRNIPEDCHLKICYS